MLSRSPHALGPSMLRLCNIRSGQTNLPSALPPGLAATVVTLERSGIRGQFGHRSVPTSRTERAEAFEDFRPQCSGRYAPFVRGTSCHRYRDLASSRVSQQTSSVHVRVNVYVCIAKVGACAYESLCVSVVCAPVNLTVAHITVANL